jgi:hypothetical protein
MVTTEYCYLRKVHSFTNPRDPKNVMYWNDVTPKVTIAFRRENGQVSFGYSVLSDKDICNRKHGMMIATGRLNKNPVTVPIEGSIKDCFRKAVNDGMWNKNVVCESIEELERHYTDDYITNDVLFDMFLENNHLEWIDVSVTDVLLGCTGKDFV